MRGLLRKDFLLAGGAGRLLLGAALALNLLPIVFRDAAGALVTLGNTYAMLLPLMVPVNVISIDERCKWDRLAAMLPCRAEQLVGSKYIVSWAYTLLACGILLFGAAVRGLAVPGTENWRDTLGVILMMLFAIILMTAIGIPGMYLFGSEKARLLILVLLTAGAGAGIAVINIIFSYGNPSFSAISAFSAISPAIWILLGAALAAFLTYVSYRLSVKFYLRRRDGRYEP